MAALPNYVEEAGTSSFLLPREAYLSREWYDREMEHVFGANWYFAGMARDVPDAGDYKCVQVGAYPMFFLRDEHGELRSFHNMCRHRGAALLAGSGNVKDGMTCFYHSWTYGLNGCLRSVPQQDQFPGLKLSEWGLKPGAVESFRGLVFVHVDPAQQGSLLEWMDDFPDHFGPFDLENYVEIRESNEGMKVNANWKLFMENHIDGYHLYHLHKDSILGINHDGQANALYKNHWSIYEPLAREGVLPEYEKGFPTKILVDDPKWHGSSVHMLFPNIGIATGAKWFATVQSIPISPTESVIESRSMILPFENGEDEVEYEYHPGSSAGTDLMGEDRLAIERLQVALGSPKFECAPLARNYERSVQAFHESLLSFLP